MKTLTTITLIILSLSMGAANAWLAISLETVLDYMNAVVSLCCFIAMRPLFGALYNQT